MVLSFEEIPPDALALVGGKALNLGRLARAGLPVPPGFVLTTAAGEAGREAEAKAAVAAAYAALGGGAVAVRSSATAEDLAGASFAGQQDTFLGVEGEAGVLAAVAACRRSLTSERARAYRAAQGIPEAAVAMAVVVQRMVPAEAAGVLFTADPLAAGGGATPIRVEAVHGLGEALVSGAVTPDWWLLDEHGNATAASPGAAVLTAQHLCDLAGLARRVRALYDAEQDVEWALAGGRIFVLQARPITARASEREAIRAEEVAFLRRRAAPEGTVWARYSLAEVLPEPLPMTWALWRQFMSGGGGYGRMYRDLGYDPDPALETDGVLDLIAGRPYFNLSRDARLYFSGFPHEYPFAKLKEDPERAIYPTLEVNMARAPRGFVLKLFGYTARMLAAEKTLARAAGEVPDRLETQVLPGMARLAAEWRGRDLAALTEGDLAAEFERRREAVFDRFAPEGLKASVLAGFALGKLRAALGPGDPPAEALLAGSAPAPEYDLPGALARLGRGEMSPAAFLVGFGHRGPGEMELARPRWRESGAPARPAVPASPAPVEPPAAVRALCRRTRRLLGLREAAKHCLMLGYEGLRSVLLELDRRRELAGGVFYLEPGELPALAAGEDLRPRIVARRRRRALALSLEAPRVLFSDDPEAIGRPLPPAAGAAELAGSGVSAGTAEGAALVLREPAAAPPEARDFILVCPSTDPGWVPLFLRARGVVLETGGVLSHGAIVARELGLPAVANVPDACRRIATGARVRLDGTAGRVWVLPEDADV